MYENILSIEQKQLLPFIQSFKKEYYLVGDTAIALQIGHRESIDFDLFKMSTINKVKITQRLNRNIILIGENIFLIGKTYFPIRKMLKSYGIMAFLVKKRLFISKNRIERAGIRQNQSLLDKLNF